MNDKNGGSVGVQVQPSDFDSCFIAEEKLVGFTVPIPKSALDETRQLEALKIARKICRKVYVEQILPILRAKMSQVKQR